tara:strand:+ start:2785 stop:3765 length:981 start_codon:yes stop_codon:yes gene_type:complete
MRYIGNICVTGGAGFIGTHVTRRLALQGYQVTVVDSLEDGTYEATIREEYMRETLLLFPDVVLRQVAVEDTDRLPDIFRQSKFDAVIHLAALAGVRPSIQDPLRYNRVNVQGTLNLLELCRETRVPIFINMSSSSVYGNIRVRPYVESMPLTEMVSPYAVTKRQAEIMVDYYAREYNMSSVSLRPFTVYGEYGRPDMFIRDTLQRVSSGETVTLFGDGTTFRDYTYVGDVVDLIVSALHKPSYGHHRIVNAGTGITTSLSDLVSRIGQTVDREPITRHIGQQQGDAYGTHANIALANHLFGYTPKVPLAQGLERTWTWMQESKCSQ